MSDTDQNILKWTCLLHDIKKRGPPVLQGKDHLHPFNGGIAVLQIFRKIGVLDISHDKHLKQIYELISKSK